MSTDNFLESYGDQVGHEVAFRLVLGRCSIEICAGDRLLDFLLCFSLVPSGKFWGNISNRPHR
jgi:hypothetical protein